RQSRHSTCARARDHQRRWITVVSLQQAVSERWCKSTPKANPPSERQEKVHEGKASSLPANPLSQSFYICVLPESMRCGDRRSRVEKTDSSLHIRCAQKIRLRHRRSEMVPCICDGPGVATS